MSRLNIRLLGSFQISAGKEPIAHFESDKVRALLAYLVVEASRPHRREVLAGLLWPDIPERSARTNLRGGLANLRKVIGDRTTDPPFLLITRQTIQFNTASDYWSDVHAFEQLADESSHSIDIEALEQAYTLYQGPFLEGFTLADSAPFEDWQRLTGEALQRRALGVIHKAAQECERLGRYDQAITLARRQLELEPWAETGHQQLMRFLAASSRRSEALAHYEFYRQTLAAELGVEPDPETTQLYESIRNGQYTPEQNWSVAQSVRGYELRERLGMGSFGIVYRAYQPIVKRDVAIKIIRPEYADQPDFIRRFEVEAQLVARLEHPHIVPLYDYWREPAGAYLVMRWLKGGNLNHAMRRGPWSVAAATGLLDQVAGALSAAHRQGVIHRDIKPANILLDEEGNGYLTDFGIATLAETAYLTALPADLDKRKVISGWPEYISPEQMRNEPLTPLADIYCLGLVMFVLLTGRHPFDQTPPAEMAARQLQEPFPAVYTLRADLPVAVNTIIQRATAKEPDQRFKDPQTFAAAFREAAVVKGKSFPPGSSMLKADPTNPYKGLRPFRETDAADFFGRESVVQQLLGRFSADENAVVGESAGRFLAVIGPSGSGKSSVVRAGLLPALRSGAVPGSEKWFIAEMIPGTHPYEELEAALMQITVKPPANLLQQLQHDERGLLRAIKSGLPDRDSQLLLFIDQFEELFTLVDDKYERQSFLDGLCAAVTDVHSRLRLVITLRADYYDRPLQYPQFGNLLRQNAEVLLPLTAEELVRVIAGPAEHAGLELEPGLVSTIVADVREETAALPLLQYALTELFENRQAQKLTLKAYAQIGGVAGALGRRAEDLYAALDPAGQEAGRQIFWRLVNPGENGADARRRVQRSELQSLQIANVPETGLIVDDVLEHFGRFRLLTFDRDQATRAPTVEIAHEALLREWPRLAGWIANNRKDLQQHQRLRAAATEWVAAGRPPGFLLRGERLDLFTQWAETVDLALAPEEKAYLEASLSAQLVRHKAEQARVEREQSLQKRTHRLRNTLVALSILTVLGVIILGVVLTFDLASGVSQALISLLNPAQSPGAVATREASSSAYVDYTIAQGLGIAFNPHGDELAVVGGDNTGTMRDVATGRVLRELQGHHDRVLNVVYSLDGSRLATTSQDGTAIVWDAASGDPLTTITIGDWEFGSPALSPDGELLATTGSDGMARIWDADTGEELAILRHGGETFGVAFSPDGSLLAVASNNGQAIIWDIATGKRLEIFYGHDGWVTDVAFSPDGQRVASAGFDATVQVWDAASGEIVAILRGHEGPVLGVDYSPDGRLIATGSIDGQVKIWNAHSGRELFTFYGHEDQVFNVAFNHDGSRLASGSMDFSTIIWKVPPAGDE